MARHPFVTVDTEFHRETTFWPMLCVVQLATDDEALAIDALAPDIDLQPLFALMADPHVVKVFHAARQDVEIFWKLAGRRAGPMFDTQVAAMVCGYGEQVSYSELVQSICKAHDRQIVALHRLGAPTARPRRRSTTRSATSRTCATIYRTLLAQLDATGRLRLARGRDARPDLGRDLRAAPRARLGAVQDPRAQAARPGRADGTRGLARAARRRRATCRARAC